MKLDLHPLILLVLLLAINCATLNAKTDVWSSLGLPGQRIATVAADQRNPGTIYAGSFSGRLFKTGDGGRTWSAKDLGAAVSAIAIDPQNSDTLYAATYRGVLKSIDAGVTWTMVADLIGCFALAIDPQNSNTVYAGNDGLFKSVDGGATWDRTSFDQSVFSLAIDPQNSRVIYAGTSFGIAKSMDAGGTWTKYRAAGDFFKTLVIDPRMPNVIYAGAVFTEGVFKSVDGGMTWMNYGIIPYPVYTMVVDTVETNTVYAATLGSPFKSVDGGMNWTAINSGLDLYRVTSMASDPAICKVYIGTLNGVFETDIGPVLTFRSDRCIGGSWTLSVSHVPPNKPIRLLGVSSGRSWEISNWGSTDAMANFGASGTFSASDRGNHELRVEVGGLESNVISFTVTDCRH